MSTGDIVELHDLDMIKNRAKEDEVVFHKRQRDRAGTWNSYVGDDKIGGE